MAINGLVYLSKVNVARKDINTLGSRVRISLQDQKRLIVGSRHWLLSAYHPAVQGSSPKYTTINPLTFVVKFVQYL